MQKEITIMPKKGIYLPPQAVEAIQAHIEQREGCHKEYKRYKYHVISLLN
jgi:hypothetical protein